MTKNRKLKKKLYIYFYSAIAKFVDHQPDWIGDDKLLYLYKGVRAVLETILNLSKTN